MSDNKLRPPEIAREALRRLATERVPPTPENYRAYYHEIAGTQSDETFPEKSLKAIAKALPRDIAERLRIAEQFEHAVASRQWPRLKEAVVELGKCSAPLQQDWGQLISSLLDRLEKRHAGLTLAQKRNALTHVIEASNGKAERLHARVQGLLHGWDALQGDPDKIETLDDAPRTTEKAARAIRLGPAADAGGGHDASITEFLSVVIRRAIVPVLEGNDSLRAEAEALAGAVALLSDDPQQAAELHARLGRLTDRIEWIEDDRRAIRESLLKLLKLVLENISQLVIDDSWLRGQLLMVSEVFSSPLDIRVLDEAERRLRDVIDKQSQLKQQLTDAQERLKGMLIGFMDRLSGFSDSTDHYHVTLERCAQEIETAENLEDLADAVGELLIETRDVRDSTRKSSEELKALREEVESANNRIVRLQTELDETSELVRHDPLTGVLNRKGIDEAMEREISVVRRRGAPLCVALLDIDNFKQLNDTFGHRAGDEALQHLTSVIRDDLRPGDTIGRYGGEEFIILLPDSTEEQGIEIVSRLQRALTKRFFLTGNSRLLITFSAGVSQMLADETSAQAIDRADRAMYAAKRAGKNRVFIAT
jgi:diguanylate cyclase